MLSVNELQFLYPNPTCLVSDDTCYCVGGALVKEYMLSWPEMADLVARPNFPEVNELAAVLQCENDNLLKERAMFFAQRIIDYNDEELYDLAWEKLARALNYKHAE